MSYLSLVVPDRHAILYTAFDLGQAVRRQSLTLCINSSWIIGSLHKHLLENLHLEKKSFPWFNQTARTWKDAYLNKNTFLLSSFCKQARAVSQSRASAQLNRRL